MHCNLCVTLNRNIHHVVKAETLNCRYIYIYTHMYVVFDSHGIGLCAITQRDESHKSNTEGNASKSSVCKGKKFHSRTQV